MTLKVSTENILVCFGQDQNTGWFLLESSRVYKVWHFHQWSYQDHYKGLTSIQLYSSPVAVAVVHCMNISVKQTCTCYPQAHEKFLNTITLKDIQLNMLSLNMLLTVGFSLVLFHLITSFTEYIGSHLQGHNVMAGVAFLSYSLYEPRYVNLFYNY